MTTLEIVSLVSTSIGILTVLGKWLIVSPLKNLIREQTYPIQPNANGGKSLPDIARATIEIKSSLEALTHQIDRVEGRLDTHIEQHVEGKA
jgi:hypothetical protein